MIRKYSQTSLFKRSLQKLSLNGQTDIFSKETDNPLVNLGQKVSRARMMRYCNSRIEQASCESFLNFIKKFDDQMAK